MRHLIYSLLATLSFGHVMSQDTTGDDSLLAWLYQFALEAQAQPLNPAELNAKYISWNMLCFELRDVSCEGISPPNVMKFKQNPLRPGLKGYYDGSDTIYIRSNLRGAGREEVLAHEMSHFVDVQLGITNVPGFPEEICYSEKRAWGVSDAYWRKYGWESRTVGSDWADWYRHCTPFKGAMYPTGE